MTAEFQKDPFDSPDIQEYQEELFKRLVVYARLAAFIPKEAPGSVEWLGRIGKFWWEAREQSGLDRYQMAERMDVHVNSVRFVEVGIGYPELGLITPDGKVSPEAVGESEFPRKYAQALGNPEFYNQFLEKFIPSPQK